MELDILRTDVIDRLLGMSRAVHVARSRGSHDADDNLSHQELNQLSAEELLKHYRRVSARFRDTFRASFDLLESQRAVARPNRREVSDYK